jgi:hypothetical protein
MSREVLKATSMFWRWHRRVWVDDILPRDRHEIRIRGRFHCVLLEQLREDLTAVAEP